MRAALFAPRDRGRRNQLEQGLSNLITSTAERSARYLIRDLRRKQTRIEENVQPIRKLLQSRQISGSVSRFHSALRPDLNCGQTPLLDTKRRTRNLSNGARRCEHCATPSKFSQRDTHPATKGHTLFSIAPSKLTIVGRCASHATILLPKYLTKVGHPKVACREMWRAKQAARRLSLARGEQVFSELSAINWNKERKQFDREHFTIAQIEVLRISRGTKISSSYGNFATVSSASGGLVGRTGKAKVLVAQSPTPVYFATRSIKPKPRSASTRRRQLSRKGNDQEQQLSSHRHADRQGRPRPARSHPPVLRRRHRQNHRTHHAPLALCQHEGGARQDAPMQEAHMKHFQEYPATARPGTCRAAHRPALRPF